MLERGLYFLSESDGSFSLYIAFFVRVVVWGWGWGWGGIVDRDVSQKNFEGNTDSDIHL